MCYNLLMEITPSAKHQRQTHAVYWIVGAIIFIITAFILWLVFSQHTTNTTLPATESAISSSLFCTTKTPKDPLLNINSEKSSYKIYALFLDKKLNNIYYESNSTFSTPTLAKTAEASLHANYNIYAGAHKFNAESYTPSFTVHEDSLKMSLYAEMSELVPSVLPIFFLNESTNLDQLTESVVETQLKSQNFTCAHE